MYCPIVKWLCNKTKHQYTQVNGFIFMVLQLHKSQPITTNVITVSIQKTDWNKKFPEMATRFLHMHISNLLHKRGKTVKHHAIHLVDGVDNVRKIGVRVTLIWLLWRCYYTLIKLCINIGETLSYSIIHFSWICKKHPFFLDT